MAKKIKDTEESFNIKDYRSEIDKYVKEKVAEEAKKVVNLKDYKDQIDKYTKERVEIESASQSVKLLKKQLHNKKISSGIKSFIILCLLACMGYGIYYLYQDGYFDENKGVKCPVNNCDVSKIIMDDPSSKTDKGKSKEVSLDELKVKYSYLLDSVIFDANSNYTRDYYQGNLTNEIKLYLSYKLLGSDEIITSDDSSYFDSMSLESSYKKLFSDKINLTSFKYNNASYIYIPGKEIYMTNNKPNEVKNITREITDITLDDENNIIITCVEGYINESGKLYNILTNKEIPGYKQSYSLSKYKDKLNTITYVFNDNYLINLYK